jgi:hypothetical protein
MKSPYPKKIRIPGTKFEAELASDEECEKVQWVLCMRRGDGDCSMSFIPQIPDARCSSCQHRVWRDARGPKLPPSLCLECATLGGVLKGERQVTE